MEAFKQLWFVKFYWCIRHRSLGKKGECGSFPLETEFLLRILLAFRVTETLSDCCFGELVLKQKSYCTDTNITTNYGRYPIHHMIMWIWKGTELHFGFQVCILLPAPPIIICTWCFCLGGGLSLLIDTMKSYSSNYRTNVYGMPTLYKASHLMCLGNRYITVL